MTVSIVSRASWGATPWRSGVNRVAMREKTAFLVHYHGGIPSASRGVYVPRNVEKIHLANGWSGVGYNFLVDLDGTVYEGRGWDGVGAQCPGYNRNGIGVYVAVGGTQVPTAAALASVRALYDEACRRSGNALRKMGHRDGTATSCPGTALYGWVRAGMPVEAPAAPAKPVPAPPVRPTTIPGQYLSADGILDVATLKVFQKAWGLSKADCDGSFGPQTRRALQRWVGVKPDGMIGPATRRALRRRVYLAASSAPWPGMSPRPDATTRAIEVYLNRAIRNGTFKARW